MPACFAPIRATRTPVETGIPKGVRKDVDQGAIAADPGRGCWWSGHVHHGHS